MRIKCDICKKVLKKQGALAFTPPDKDHMVTKLHICGDCWGKKILPLIPVSDFL